VQRSRNRLRLCAVAWVASVLVAVWAIPAVHGGTVVDVKTVYFDEQRADETATIYFEANRARFDAAEGGRRVILIVRTDAKGEPVCWVIDQEKNAYIEIDRKGVDEVKSQVERARLLFEQQIANAPPESRERVRQGLEAQYGAMMKKRPTVEFKKIATGVTIKKWRCTQYQSTLDGEKYEDVWAAGEKDLGLTPSDLKVLSQMGELFSGISPKTNAFFQVGRPAGGFTGFPVVVVEYRGGQKHEKSEVTGVRQEKLDPALFELPKDVVKQRLVQ